MPASFSIYEHARTRLPRAVMLRIRAYRVCIIFLLCSFSFFYDFFKSSNTFTRSMFKCTLEYNTMLHINDAVRTCVRVICCTVLLCASYVCARALDHVVCECACCGFIIHFLTTILLQNVAAAYLYRNARICIAIGGNF